MQTIIKCESRVEYATRRAREMALALGPGGKLPTIRVLCKELNVAITTLVDAFRTLEAQGVVKCIQGSGIYVLPGINQKKVGLVFGNNVFGEGVSPFYSLLLERCRQRSESKNEHFSYYLDFDVANGQNNGAPVHRDLADALENRKLDAIILVARHSEQQEAWLRERGIPLVSMVDSGEPYTVTVDYAGLTRLGVKALAEQGCRRIGMISPFASGTEAKWKLKNAVASSFATALAQKGLPFHPEWIQFSDPEQGITVRQPERMASSWYARAFASSPAKSPPAGPDGVIVLNDMITRGLVETVERNGLVLGRDLRIASHANKGSRALTGLRSRLTLIEVDPDEIVDAMFDMLEQLMNGDVVSQKVKLVGGRIVPPGTPRNGA